MKNFLLLSLVLLASFVAQAQANFTNPTISYTGSYAINWTFEAHSACSGGGYVTPFKIQELNSAGQILKEEYIASKPYNVYGKQNGSYTYKLWTYLCSSSGNTYYYRGSVTVTVNMSVPPLSPPTFTATASDPAVLLTWTKPSDPPFTYYQIQRNGTSIATPSNTATSYVDTAPVVGTNTYNIRTCVSSSAGCSAWKASNSVTIAPPTPVGSLSSELTNGVVNSAPITGEPSSFVGSVAGEFRVNESGAATYNVAIKMPDGVAGVKPQVNIGYSSQAGNGLLGKGWNMGGLSGISRCRQTLSQDGVAKPITWTAEDRFCLDGQRLMLSSGTYGASGSVYKTEIDTFVTVTAVGGTNGNPDYFTAVAKDGSTTTYGSSGAVGSEVATASGIMGWNISKFEDSVGNPINYLYEGGATDGHRIKEIYYAYGSSKSLYSNNAKVVFTYEDRDDSSSGYATGYKFSSTKRLKKITTYNGNNVFREYTLGYDYAPAAIGSYSRVKNIKECADVSGLYCYPATTFSWHERTSINFNIVITDKNLGPDSANISNYTFMDINGNGILDYVWSKQSSGNNTIYYTLDAASAATGSDKSLFSYSSSTAPKFEVIDYNGDAHQDLMVYDPKAKQWRLYLSTPDTTGWNLKYHSILPFIDKNIAVADVDSDGLADVMESNGDKTLKFYKLERRLSAAVTSNTYYQFGAPISYEIQGDPVSLMVIDAKLGIYEKNFAFGDFNGDGRADLAASVYDTRHNPQSDDENSKIFFWDVRVYLADEFNKFNYYSTLITAGEYDGVTALLGGDFYGLAASPSINSIDFNNDGLSDVFYKKKKDGKWYYRINTGSGFSAEINITEISTDLNDHGEQMPTFNDINRDGYFDIIWRQKKTGYSVNPISIKYWDPKTSTFGAAQILETGASNDLSYSYLDADGDTWLERVTFGKKSGYMNLSINSFTSSPFLNKPDLIDGFTDGLGNHTSVIYSSMSRSSRYVPIGDIKITGTTSYVCSPIYSTYNPYASPPITQIGEDCRDVPSYNVNSDDFYRQVNDPFAGLTNNNLVNAPVLEAVGAMPIVTRASSTVHATNSTSPGNASSRSSSVDYYYKRMRMQAAGRGMLGFAELKTVDLQTGITTETKYRQDWPYIGSPVETITKTHDGKVLSHATNKWNRKTFGTSTKRYQPYIEQTVERSYALNSDGSVGTDPLQTVTTDTQTPDDYGNIGRITVTTAGAGQTLVQQTDNLYFTSTWEKQMGRLERSTVSATRNGVPDSNRTVRFEYYQAAPHKGLLSKEVVAEGTADQLVTTYVYDEFGNKKDVSVTGKATSTLTQTRKTTYVYDTIGRYVTSTYNDLNHVSTIVSRDPTTGAPTQIKDANNITAEVRYDKMGNEYLRIDSSGAWSRTDIAPCGTYVGVSTQCPIGAKYYQLKRVAGGGMSIDYLDGLGRVLRAAMLGFDGRWVYTDSEYDGLGRVKYQSPPYFESSSPVGWTTYNYDRLGRVESVTEPDGSVSSSAYNGYETTITNARNQTRTETRNGLGQLIGVRDYLGGTIAYTYNIKGDLLTVTTDDAPSASPNVAPVTVTMCYDALGRKTAMHDPDKGGFKLTGTVDCGGSKSIGWWQYKYNAFGELIEQLGPEARSSVMTYDVLGRMITRKDLKSGSLDGNTAWFYDAPLGGAVTAQTKGKLTAVIMNKVNSTIANSQTSCGGTNHCTQTQYDAKSRPEVTFTHLPDGSDFITSIKYDTIGRAYEQRDVLQSVFSNSGVQTQYNPYGYAYRTVDIAPRDGTRGVLSHILEMNERGQVVREVRGNGAVTTNTYDPYTGLLDKQLATVTGLRDIQNNTYDWDTVGNLKYRITAGAKIGSTASKAKEEGFCYDGLNRLIATLPSRTPACGGTADLRYDGLGNITYKKGVGDYVYDRVNGGAHAVTSVNGVNYRYDANGNVTSGDGRTFEYTSYDMASKISKDASNYVQFNYGPDRARWQRIDVKNNVTTTTTYLGNVERISKGTSTVEWKRTVGGVVHTYKTTNNVLDTNGTDKKYLYLDHLGSVDAITDGVGKVTHSMSFDPWGARRSGEDWTGYLDASLSLTGFTQPITTRGYTGHEMVDGMDIIHMNGRIYDARIARFMQADPHIDGVKNTQGYNRYSYVQNNPLNATDPSGFLSLSKVYKSFIKSNGQWQTHELLNKHAPNLIPAIQTALNFIPVIGWIISAAFGANNAFFVSGGNLRAGVRPFATSVASYFVFSAIGSKFSAKGGFYQAGGAGHIFAHAVAGGVISVVQGGKFGHGFASAGLTKGFMSHSGFDYSDGSTSAIVGRTVAAAVVGGTISEITGGKFANGAMTAAMAHLFNQERSTSKQAYEEWKNRFGVNRTVGPLTLSERNAMSGITKEEGVYTIGGHGNGYEVGGYNAKELVNIYGAEISDSGVHTVKFYTCFGGTTESGLGAQFNQEMINAGYGDLDIVVSTTMVHTQTTQNQIGPYTTYHTKTSLDKGGKWVTF